MGGHDRLTPEGRRFFEQIEELKKLEVRVDYQARDSDATGEDGKKVYGKAGVRKKKINGVKVGGKKGVVVDSDSVTILDIAMWNELGTSRAPARPFLRKSVDENTDKIKAACAAQLKKLANGGTAEQCLRALGTFQKGLIQEKIKNGSFTPDADSTTQKKGSDKPLIDTGRLRQSVEFIIQNKGD